MDKSLKYKGIIKVVLNRYLEIDRRSPLSGVESYLSVDDANAHYIWGSVGWVKGKRARHIHAHLRVKDGQIWIETDLTEQGIANDLLLEGVPKEDVVLAFHEPSVRQFNDLAVI